MPERRVVTHMPTDSRQQLHTIWAYRRWLALFVIVVTVGSYVLAKRQTPKYKADALVQVVSATEASGQVLPADAQQSLVNTYLRIAQTDPVYRLGAASMTPKTSASAFSEHVALSPESGSAVFDVTGSATVAAQAAAYSNAYANAFSQYVEQLQNRQRQSTVARIQQQIDTTAGQAGQPNSLQSTQVEDQLKALESKLSETVAAPADAAQVIGTAAAPTSPSSPRPKLNAVLALIGSLVFGIAAILLYSTLSDRYRDADEAARDLDVPLLGEIPRAGLLEQPSIESFRRLRTAIEFEFSGAHRMSGSGARNGGVAAVVHSPAGRTVLVTAAERGAGKSYTTAGLSRALAAGGVRVVAVDGDLRKPTLHDQLGARSAPGLGDALSERITHIERLAQAIAVPRGGQGGELDVVAAGRPMSDATEQLSSSTMDTLVAELRRDYRYVVFDSSPVLPVVDAVVLARHCDGVVFVVDAKRTRRRDVRRAVQTLRATGAPILGFVYNRTHAQIASYGYGEVPSAATERGASEVLR
jgi:capsular exopolysaccharide synthesis family protein